MANRALFENVVDCLYQFAHELAHKDIISTAAIFLRVTVIFTAQLIFSVISPKRAIYPTKVAILITVRKSKV